MAIIIKPREVSLKEKKQKEDELFTKQRANLLPSPRPKYPQQNTFPLPYTNAKKENVFVPDFVKNLHSDIRKTDEEIKENVIAKVASNNLSKLSDKTLRSLGLGAEQTAKGIVGSVEGTNKVLNFIRQPLGDASKIAGDLFSLGRKAENPISDFFYDFSDATNKVVEKNLSSKTTDKWEKSIEKRYKPTEQEKNLGKFIEAGSGMIPSIAANTILPGAGLPLIATSAAGTSAVEGYKKSGDVDNALIYGALSGLTEAATEKLFTGIPLLQQNGVASNVINKVTSKLNKSPKFKNALNSVIDVLGEGAEEAISTFIDPYLQRAFVDKNATNASKEEIMQSAIMGGLLSLVMNSGFKAADLLSNGKNTDTQKPNLNLPDKVYMKDPSVNVTVPQAGTKLDSTRYDFVPPNTTSIQDLDDNKSYIPNQLPIPKLSDSELAKLKESIAKAEDAKGVPLKEIFPHAQNNALEQNVPTKGFIPNLQETTPTQTEIDVNTQNLYDTVPPARINGIIETGTDADYTPITIPQTAPRQSNFATEAEQVSNTLKEPSEFKKTFPETYEEVTASYKEQKPLQQAFDKIDNDSSITTEEKKLAKNLLNGTNSLEQIQGMKNINVDNVMRFYDVSKSLADNKKGIELYKKNYKETLFDEALNDITNSNDWKEKKTPFGYSSETMQRNNFDIIPDKAEAETLNRKYFDVGQVAEASGVRFKNKYRKRIKALNLNEYESAMTQLKGEMDFYEKNPTHKISKAFKEQVSKELLELSQYKDKIDMGKVEKAIVEFRTIYDELLPMMNEALIKNGYDPVEARQGYFPHFTEKKPDGVLQTIFDKAGFELNYDELPTDIAGLTHQFKPGKTWNRNLQKREGDQTTFDAIQGFDRYIESAASLIFRTDVIQKQRALEKAIRFKYSSDGAKEQYYEIVNNENLTNAQKQNEINTLFEKNSDGHLSRYVSNLRVYTDLYANKKHLSDRNMESEVGRTSYNIIKNIESRVAANMIAANIGTAMTNLIPLTQAVAIVKPQSMLKAAYETVNSYFIDDGFIDRSTFLTNRRGSDRLTQKSLQKVSEVLSKPMYYVDDFVSNVVTRAKYNDNLKNGMDDVTARGNADKFAASLIADRSKGAMPTMFEKKNPVSKALTMFQLEVNNQLRYFTKDVPRELKEKSLGALLMGYAKAIIGAYAFNELYYFLFGRRPALDGFGMAKRFAENITEKGGKPSVAIGELGKEIAEQTPFIGGLIGGGRIPIGAALPNIAQLSKLGDSDIANSKKWEIGSKEVLKPLTYLVPPFAGGTAKKLYQGIEHNLKGGTYTLNKEGEKQLQYPANQDIWNTIKAPVFGKTSTEAGRGWIESGFDNLSAKQTAVYDKFRKEGLANADAYKLATKMSELKTENLSADDQRDELSKMDITPEQKEFLDKQTIGELKQPRDYSDPISYEASKLSEKYYNSYKQLTKAGVDKQIAFDVVNEINGLKKAEEKRAVLYNSDMTDGQKFVAANQLLPKTKTKYDYSNKENYWMSTFTEKEMQRFKNVKMFTDMSAEDFAVMLEMERQDRKNK